MRLTNHLLRIEWAEPALDDMAGIQAYIAKDSPVYARQFIERLFEVAEHLTDFPAMGRKVPEAEDRDNIRELIFQGYRMLYWQQPDRVCILAVIHGSRDIAGMDNKPWLA